MTDTTPRAGAPLLAASQAQKTVTHNEALYQFDALLCARFLDRDLTAPPSSPADGDTYLVKATATGAWAGQDGKIAYCADGGWRFYAPFGGLVAYVTDETKLIVHDGAAWVDYASVLALQNVPLLGVNTTADSTNKLAVQSNAALFADLPTGSGGSGDVRVTLSKQTSSNTASLVLQDNFSGRAEIGLTGDDDFHIKVSPDGSAWFEALTLARASGHVALPAGQLGFPATQNASSDANTLDDYEEGNWTPVLTAATTAPTGVAYSTQSGNYTKIGRLVFVTFNIGLTSLGTGGAGAARLTGLPFATDDTNGIAQTTFRAGNIALQSGYSQFTAQISGSIVSLQANGSNVANVNVNWTDFTSTASLRGSGFYITAT